MKVFLLALAFFTTPTYANTCLDRYKAITKVEGEHAMHRYLNNKATVILGLKTDKQVNIKFDNATCKVENVSYTTTKKYNQTLKTIKTAYVDQNFCDFIRKHRGNLAQLPKDFGVYSCEKLNCGAYDQAAGFCYCGKEKMATTCCRSGHPQENTLLPILNDFSQLKLTWLKWEEMSSEFASESNKRCMDWSSLLSPVANTSMRPLDR